MANWQASLLMQTLSTGSVLVLQRDKTDGSELPTLHGGDTFYGSLPDGDPFGGTVMERHEGRAIVVLRSQSILEMFLRQLSGTLGGGGSS